MKGKLGAELQKVRDVGADLQKGLDVITGEQDHLSDKLAKVQEGGMLPISLSPHGMLAPNTRMSTLIILLSS